MRDDALARITRRHFFGSAGISLGTAALAALSRESSHARPRAKRVIFLFMRGGPSSLDLFDPKPELSRHHGSRVPERLIQGERFAFIKGATRFMGSPRSFRRHGESGAPFSDLLPHLARRADELAFVRSLHTDHFNHAPAQILMNSGHAVAGRPSMGSWVGYGIGSESKDLPAFTVLVSGLKDAGTGEGLWSSGFLPPVHQGVELRTQRDALACLADPPDVDRAARRRSIDLITELDRLRRGDDPDPETAARIGAYELAFRMQTSVPGLMDLSGESEEVRRLYGAVPGKPTFANHCLLARRLVERGVRFVQLYHGGWDHHGGVADRDILEALPQRCDEIDRPCAALLEDLRRRGLLEDTLVVWGGEFGRTPMSEQPDLARHPGRDHHPRAFTMWLAGGGVRAGASVGATDELGWDVAADPVHVHDLQATILHLLGIDHERLTYRFQGRDFRLTDVAGRVVPGLLA
jgi:hypothetical protein